MASPRDLFEYASRSSSPWHGAVRVGVIYLAAVAFGVLWLTFSNPGFEALVGSGTGGLQAAGFVAASTLVLVLLAHHELKKGWTKDEHRTLIDLTPAGISVVQDGGFAYVNDRFAEIFGYEPEELVESPIGVTDLVDPEEREVVVENLRKRLDGEVQDIRYRYTGVKKTGGVTRVDVHGRRITWKGRPAVMSLHLQVTEEERLQRQAWGSQRMEALGHLTGAVAHDFNNLLTTILTPLGLCEEQLDPDHPARPDLEEAKEGAQRAVTLTRQLLAFSRRRIYRPRPIDLSELVKKAEPMLSRLLPAGVEMHLELTDAPLAVEVDPSHFEQVLLNLVTNAGDAVGTRGKIRICTYPERSARGPVADLILEVVDDGQGMDEETRARVFEPFYTTRENGTGLGLSTVHGIVMQEGGEITVESTPGEGTTFRLRLPGSTEEAEPLESGGEGRKRRAGPFTKGTRILVVDDDDAILRVTARALERYGLSTETASSAAAARELVREEPERFDILLTDVGLGDMNGVDLAAEIRKDTPGILVLYMSGHSDEAVLSRLGRERSSGFVEKPFSVEGLLEAVERALERGRDGRGQETA